MSPINYLKIFEACRGSLRKLNRLTLQAVFVKEYLCFVSIQKSKFSVAIKNLEYKTRNRYIYTPIHYTIPLVLRNVESSDVYTSILYYLCKWRIYGLINLLKGPLESHCLKYFLTVQKVLRVRQHLFDHKAAHERIIAKVQSSRKLVLFLDRFIENNLNGNLFLSKWKHQPESVSHREQWERTIYKL